MLSYFIDDFNEPLITFYLLLNQELYPVQLFMVNFALIKAKITRGPPIYLYTELESQTLCVNMFSIGVYPYQFSWSNSTRMTIFKKTELYYNTKNLNTFYTVSSEYL